MLNIYDLKSNDKVIIYSDYWTYPFSNGEVCTINNLGISGAFVTRVGNNTNPCFVSFDNMIPYSEVMYALLRSDYEV